MNYSELCVDASLPVSKVLGVIERTHMQAVVVTDEGFLKGTVTDGDIRRYLLKNNDLSVPIKKIMCSHPVYLPESQSDLAVKCMRENRIQIIPIINSIGKVVDIKFENKYETTSREIQEKLKDIPIVIMAGGKGERLLPYTSILPKPLMPVAGKTILESIMDSFSKYGCKEYYLTLNYKKEIIKAYLKDVNNPYKINYIEEKEYMGTAGSLVYLKDVVKATFIVSNCDILLDVNYSDLVEQHQRNKNKITIVLLRKDYTIPYGTVDIDDQGQVVGLQEKPQLDFRLNTGVYVMEPDVISDMTEQYLHMTELINRTLEKGDRVGTYLIDENRWMDIGELDGLTRVNGE